MKKFIAILGLILVLMIQFGSAGFKVYNNKCNTKKTSTYSLNKTGCICGENTTDSNQNSNKEGCCKKKTEKKCCEVKQKTCCSKKKNTDSESLHNNCCNTNEILLKLACESFDINSYNYSINEVSAEDYLSVISIQKNVVHSITDETLYGKYKCNSPPFV